jgi:hypothetical protein
MKKKSLKRFLTLRYVMVLVIFLIISILWFRYLTGVILIAIFIPFTFITMRYAKLVPHITIESNTAFTIFLGYAYGPLLPMIYGPIVGGTCYAINGVVTPPSISTVILSGITGAIASFLHTAFGASFATAFFVSFIIRTILALPWMMLFVAPFESFTHQITQLFSNLIIYLPLLSALYSLLAPIL